MTVDALAAILLIPAITAAVLALLPGYMLTARLNVVATLLTFLTSLSLFMVEPVSGQYLLAENQNSNSIAVFRIDASSGSLAQASLADNIPSPVCLAFFPR